MYISSNYEEVRYVSVIFHNERHCWIIFHSETSQIVIFKYRGSTTVKDVPLWQKPGLSGTHFREQKVLYAVPSLIPLVVLTVKNPKVYFSFNHDNTLIRHKEVYPSTKVGQSFSNVTFSFLFAFFWSERLFWGDRICIAFGLNRKCNASFMATIPSYTTDKICVDGYKTENSPGWPISVLLTPENIDPVHDRTLLDQNELKRETLRIL